MRTRLRPLFQRAVLPLLLGAAAFAQSAGEDGEMPAGAKREIRTLGFTVLDLVYSSTQMEGKPVQLEGKPVGLGGKPSDLAGKPADIVGKVEDLNIQETETEVRIELSGDILFDFDKATLRPEANPVLQRVTEVIGKYGKPMVRIEGHTDSKGNDDYNFKLSQRRADSVKDWLVGKGALGGVLFTKGLGETKPVAPNENPDGSDNPDGRQKNRRVEIIIKKI